MEGKTLKHVGSGISLVGIILCFSTFVTSCSQFGDPVEHDEMVARGKHEMGRFLGGMVLVVVGGIVGGVGHKRARGAAAIPGATRRGPDPSRGPARAAPPKVVMIKCRSCETLNEEESKFCQECGERL